MKWLLIIVLISIIMLIAHSVSEQYKDKYDFILNLKLFLQQFKINVAFRKEKINEFISKIKPKRQFSLFLSEYQNYLATGNINLDSIKLLDEEDKEELMNIITNLGKFDAQNEISQLDNFLASLEFKLSKAKEDKLKLCPMILKLSLLFAIGLAILLI